MIQVNDDLGERVKKFLSKEISVKENSIKSSDRLFHDLGVDGDDAYELLQHYSVAFNVDLTQFEFSDYFGEEGTGSLLGYIDRLFSTGQARAMKKPITVEDLIVSAKLGVCPNNSMKAKDIE